MKKLICLLACVMFNLTYAQQTDPVRVNGLGLSVDAAKEHAFRTAIELKVVSVIVSEIQVNNGELVKNEILDYSSGYIDRYQIVDTQQIGNQYMVVVDVWVASSKIADRILGTGPSSKSVDGDRHYTQFQTLLETKEKGDRLLKQVLNDFPKKAFVVSQGKYELVLDANRNLVLVVPMSLGWNYNYLMSLNEVMHLLGAGVNEYTTKPNVGYTVIRAKPPGNFFGVAWNHRFTDTATFNTIMNTLDSNQPRILMTVKDKNNRAILTKCYRTTGFTEYPEGRQLYTTVRNIDIMGSKVETGYLDLYIDARLKPKLAEMNSVELSIISRSECGL